MWLVPLQSINLVDTGEGTEILIVGLLALLLVAAVLFKNTAAAMFWGVSVMTLLFVGLFGVSVFYFWLAALSTVILVVVGLGMRWFV